MLECFPMRFSNPISFIRCTFFAIFASRSSSNCDKGVVKVIELGRLARMNYLTWSEFLLLRRLLELSVVVVV